MNAVFACLTGAKKIELMEKEIAPAENQVLVRMIACGICNGDVQIFRQDRNAPKPFGHEPVGEVLDVGPGVNYFKPGDRVVGCIGGSFATAFITDATKLFKVSPELGNLAALAESLKCVTTVSRAAAPDFGDCVAVVGAGFMGLGSVSMLADAWCRTLVAVDPEVSRRAAALKFGADEALDPTADDFNEQVDRVTRGRGMDAAIEFAGSPRAVTTAAMMLRRRGRLVLGGGNTVGSDCSKQIYMKAITVHHAPPMFSPDEPDDWHRCIRAMEDGRYPLEDMVSHTFKLSEIQQAMECADQGAKNGYLKGIVRNDISGE